MQKLTPTTFVPELSYIAYFVHYSFLKAFLCLNFHFSIYISNLCHQLKVQGLQLVEFLGILITVPSRLRLIKTSNVANELVILSNSS